ncbi:ORF86 [Helicoverpa zea single nucleopolyhedrovirus]|uniref:Orf86-like protein n=2 Tax=Alphabaculovirus helarmigerae TaxID=3047947 RepID=Q8V5R8_9ABAC|nr:ORF86 [Helicoverpa zea single nucleopolyhedrovirus]AAM78584.1 Orf86-like protein [Helicoverpa armigera nucleopolyhedrovirus]AHN05461.1 ORF86 [Helicoverpa zea single nucleopolyhedrovirus]AJP07505.1 hypothetical protein ORF-81 [Helicoverpa armigera nucleopolyhedrovirus]AJP07777.1 hypothetical protein ORF-82 [Helicoverpa armigera nucleopolyhedrovirus]
MSPQYAILLVFLVYLIVAMLSHFMSKPITPDPLPPQPPPPPVTPPDDDDNLCPTGFTGRYLYAYCDTYVQCPEKTLHVCPSCFDSKTQQCSTSCDCTVQCDNYWGRLPHKYDCQKFILCLHPTAMMLRCSDSFCFDPEIDDCVNTLNDNKCLCNNDNNNNEKFIK